MEKYNSTDSVADVAGSVAWPRTALLWNPLPKQPKPKQADAFKTYLYARKHFGTGELLHFTTHFARVHIYMYIHIYTCMYTEYTLYTLHYTIGTYKRHQGSARGPGVFMIKKHACTMLYLLTIVQLPPSSIV